MISQSQYISSVKSLQSETNKLSHHARIQSDKYLLLPRHSRYIEAEKRNRLKFSRMVGFEDISKISNVMESQNSTIDLVNEISYYEKKVSEQSCKLQNSGKRNIRSFNEYINRRMINFKPVVKNPCFEPSILE